MSTYYTVAHPDEFTIDWKAFYETMNARRADVRDQYPHISTSHMATTPNWYGASAILLSWMQLWPSASQSLVES